MSESFVLDNIPVQIDLEALTKKLRLKPNSVYSQQFESMVQEAQAIARPKAFFKLAFIDSNDDMRVVLDGITLTSRVLSRNLKHTHRAFVYLVTCGTEIDEWGHSFDDMLPHFWADAIMEHVLHHANHYLDEHLQQRYNLGRTASMHPGSLADWPLSAQRDLFDLLGDVQAAIGVKLTESLLMLPAKSVSGLRFSVVHDFTTCALCPRENCSGRRAPYDPQQVEEYLAE